MSTVGERLREERDRLGMNQTAFAAQGGVQKRAQINYEANERKPDTAYLEAIAKVGADVQYIVTGARSGAALTGDEQALLALFRAAPLAVKAAAMGALQGASAATAQQQKADAHYEGSKQVFNGNVGDVAGRDINK